MTRIFSIFLGIVLTSPFAQSAEPQPGFNTPIPAEVLTPALLESRIGTLRNFDGLPDEAAVEAVYENLDFLRGVEVFLNFIPATSIEGIRRGLIQVGAKTANHIVIFEQLMDSNPLFLTGNTDTVYALAVLDLKRDGGELMKQKVNDIFHTDGG